MTTQHPPLPDLPPLPGLPLPAFPPAPGANLFESYAMAAPVSIQLAAEWFMDLLDDELEWDYELLGPWVRSIGYSLWLLASNIEGRVVGDPLDHDGVSIACRRELALELRALSAEWAHMPPNSCYFNRPEAQATCLATLAALERTEPVLPCAPCRD